MAERQDPWSKIVPFDMVKDEQIFTRDSNVSWKYELDNFAVYFKHKRQNLLPKQLRARGFDRVQHFMYWVTRSHFGQKFQSDQDKQDQRVLSYFEWAELFWFQKPNQLRFCYQKNFAGIEAVLQLRRLGIALPNNSCLLNCKTKFIQEYILYMVLKRDNISFERYWYLLNGRDPTEKRLAEHLWYNDYIDNILSIASACSSEGYRGKEAHIHQVNMDVSGFETQDY